MVSLFHQCRKPELAHWFQTSEYQRWSHFFFFFASPWGPVGIPSIVNAGHKQYQPSSELTVLVLRMQFSRRLLASFPCGNTLYSVHVHARAHTHMQSASGEVSLERQRQHTILRELCVLFMSDDIVFPCLELFCLLGVIFGYHILSLSSSEKEISTSHSSSWRTILYSCAFHFISVLLSNCSWNLYKKKQENVT